MAVGGNFSATVCDYSSVDFNRSTCETWQEAISAALDNEGGEVDTVLLDAHLRSCVECANYRDFAHALRRGQMEEVKSVPDIAQHVVKQARVNSSDLKWRISRAVLAVCALEVIVFSVGDLAGSDHDARHLGAFSIAFGVALFVVVVRPARARMMLPVAGVLAVALSISAVVDVIAGRLPLVTEARHLPEIVSVLMLWLLASPMREQRSRSRPVRWSPKLLQQDRDSA